MTVKEIFDLRKQGRIEEAYDAIRPLYAQHKGRYTTLCMFWTAADVFKLRLEQRRYDEAEKILEALKRMLPHVEAINKELDTQHAAPATDKPKLPWETSDLQKTNGSASAFLASAIRRLKKISSSRAASDTIEKSTKFSVPAPGIPAAGGNNLQDLQDFASASEQAAEESPQGKENAPAATTRTSSVLIDSVDEEPPATNAQLLHDYPGHLIVSLDDGIIRPVEGLNAPQRIVLACLTAHPGYSVPQISASTGIPEKSVERHVAALIEKNIIEHRGSKKTGGYYVI